MADVKHVYGASWSIEFVDDSVDVGFVTEKNLTIPFAFRGRYSTFRKSIQAVNGLDECIEPCRGFLAGLRAYRVI